MPQACWQCLNLSGIGHAKLVPAHPADPNGPQETTFPAVSFNFSYTQLTASSMTCRYLAALIVPNDHETPFAHHGS
jgi:hypothetical protein